jgi:mRNA-degrading endonuclease RelE of RelBE toxin-antitoxin system
MAYRIELVGAAKADLRKLRATDRAKVLDRIETHLTQQPTLQSRSRIKRLRPGTYPPYRLRADRIRVYYDVDEPQPQQVVIVLGIVSKDQSAAWLAGAGRPPEGEGL